MGVEEDEAASYPAAKGEEGGRVVRRLAKACERCQCRRFVIVAGL